MRHIQYQGETLPPSPLVLAFHLVLHNFYIYIIEQFPDEEYDFPVLHVSPGDVVAYNCA